MLQCPSTNMIKSETTHLVNKTDSLTAYQEAQVLSKFLQWLAANVIDVLLKAAAVRLLRRAEHLAVRL